MFTDLVESRPHRERSAAQMVASIVAHSLVIAVSIRLTGAVAESAVRPPIETAMQLTRSPDQSAARTVVVPTTANIAAPPTLPTAPPVDVPAGIPPALPGRSFDPGQFNPAGSTGMSAPTRDSTPTDPRALVTAQQADEPAEYLDGPPPLYPPALRQVGVQGFVQLRYIVGVDGRAEPGSVNTVQSSNAAFEAPAIEAIERARFRPARLGGRVVREVVEQIVRFTIR